MASSFAASAHCAPFEASGRPKVSVVQEATTRKLNTYSKPGVQNCQPVVTSDRKRFRCVETAWLPHDCASIPPARLLHL
jgi:hypothetical protein